MGEKDNEGLGISGFTLGVIGVIFSGWIGIIISIVGLVFCLLQQKRHKTKLGKAGVIINIIGLVLGIAIVVLYSSVIAPLLSQLPSA
jgi:hypothetical protein